MTVFRERGNDFHVPNWKFSAVEDTYCACQAKVRSNLVFFRVHDKKMIRHRKVWMIGEELFNDWTDFFTKDFFHGDLDSLLVGCRRSSHDEAVTEVLLHLESLVNR